MSTDAPVQKPSRFRIPLSYVSLATIVTLLSLIVAGMGYGLTLAIESVFRMPGGSSFSSALDLFDLAAKYVLPLLFVKFTHFYDLSTSSVWLLPAVFASLCLLLLLPLIFSLLDRLGRWLDRKRRSVRERRGGLSPTGRVPSAVFMIASVVLPAALPWMIWAGVIIVARLYLVVLLMLIGAPLVGFQMGYAYILDYVVSPERCAPPRSQADLLKVLNSDRKKEEPRDATCVRVSRDGLSTVGRVVISSTSAVVLFDPISGKATREPIDSARVESIGTLEPSL